MHQRRELPVVDEQRGKPVGDSEVALQNHNDVADVAIIRTAWTVVETGIPVVLKSRTGIVALCVIEIHALRPCVICQQAEGRREAMLNRCDQAVVIGHGVVVHKDGAVAAAILIALSRILLCEIETLSLVSRCGARRSSSARRLPGRTRGDDSRAAGASGPPYSGNVESRADRSARRSMDSMTAQ